MDNVPSETRNRARPRVSAVIPNFNYARYLPQRLDSVFNQTFQDFEVILLDDASTDDSTEIIERLASDPRVTIRLNETNSGCVFKQWNLGVQLARGEYVWIAEADDVADPTLLESLVGILDANPGVGLAYCQSWKIDASGHVLGTMRESGRWDADFINNGRNEIQHLLQTNTIPNASAVVFRRELYQRLAGAPEWLLLNGDWYTWVKMLMSADVAFVARPLNYFRHHDATVRNAVDTEPQNVIENYEILRLIQRNVPIERHNLKARRAYLRNLWLSRRAFQSLGFRNACQILSTAVTIDSGVIFPFCLQAAKAVQSRCALGLRSALRRSLSSTGYERLRVPVQGRKRESRPAHTSE